MAETSSSWLPALEKPVNEVIREQENKHKNILNDGPKHELERKFEIRSVKPKVFATQDGPDERNPVFVYKFIARKDQTHCWSPRPLSILVSTIQWILVDASAMGANKLNSLMKNMANKVGLDEKRRLTNHSAGKTMMQKINESNVPPTHIIQLSGHCDTQSVNNYSSVSKE